MIRHTRDKYIKYPKTPYFSFSAHHSRKPERIFDITTFKNRRLVITTKMDGSNFTMTKGYVATRNGMEAGHLSFALGKQLHAAIKHLIPSNLQVFGEWLYAHHSIHYTGDLALPALFQVFNIYDTTREVCLSWSRVEEEAKKLGFITVPVIEEIQANEDVLTERITYLAQTVINKGQEGVVVRWIDEIPLTQWEQAIAKFVRKGHVQTDQHWSFKPVVRNELQKG